MMGLPLELMTMLGSGLLAGILSIWSKSIEAKQAQHTMAIEALKVKAKVVDDARRYDKPAFQFTRRIIALTAVFAIVLLPKMVAILNPEIGVTVGWTEWKPGFLFFEGKESVQWQTLKGFVITPLDTHLMSAIVGLYFGASIVKNAR